MDFCKLFEDIETNPRASVDMTVGERQQAVIHVRSCAMCLARVKRVAALYDQDPPLIMGLN